MISVFASSLRARERELFMRLGLALNLLNYFIVRNCWIAALQWSARIRICLITQLINPPTKMINAQRTSAHLSCKSLALPCLDRDFSQKIPSHFFSRVASRPRSLALSRETVNSWTWTCNMQFAFFVPYAFQVTTQCSSSAHSAGDERWDIELHHWNNA